MNTNTTSKTAGITRLAGAVSSPIASLLFCVLFMGASVIQAQTTNVYVDPSQNWLGYMNWQPAPNDPPGGGGVGSSAWGTPALQAVFSGPVLTISPNVNTYDNTGDSYWVNPDGTGANTMDASMYVENASLAGNTVTFSGNVWNNSLVSPYTSVAFIKDFTTGYSLVGSATTPLVSGPFTVSLATTPGDIIQYGFETVGPNANPATVSSLGSAIVASNAPPAGPVISAVTASPTIAIVGSNVLLTASASSSDPLTYQWQKNGVNVSGETTSTLALTDVTSSAEADYSVVVSDATLNESSTGSVYLVVENPAHLTVDPNAPWIGYMNFFSINDDGSQGGYETGQSYQTAALRAGFVNGAAILAPNTNLYQPGNLAYVNPDGSSAASLEADYYIQDDNLAGQTLTMVGYCPSNNLAGAYVSSVFIEDFNSSYTIVASAVTNLTAGQPFSITVPTSVGDHIQYGLRLDGPIANPSGALDAQGGSALTSVEISVALPMLAASRAGNVISLSFLSESGHSYTVQYKNNLTDAWSNLSTLTGNGLSLTAQDTAGVANRFYRLSIQ